ncbi:hypothetical protein DM02DRAFT_90479 [Periconia macrospinosa]|uniref:Uncharacterized protein n=1 Tax=Periconia macrospinosa TaxID=97972 RepID=A0A2V1DGI9_9PLEO|nr:hypothetical protein DM02DRAFT_90479 [Periconia macrospinosa]
MLIRTHHGGWCACCWPCVGSTNSWNGVFLIMKGVVVMMLFSTTACKLVILKSLIDVLVSTGSQIGYKYLSLSLFFCFSSLHGGWGCGLCGVMGIS